jgi:hypothetical protein
MARKNDREEIRTLSKDSNDEADVTSISAKILHWERRQRRHCRKEPKVRVESDIGIIRDYGKQLSGIHKNILVVDSVAHNDVMLR